MLLNNSSDWVIFPCQLLPIPTAIKISSSFRNHLLCHSEEADNYHIRLSVDNRHMDAQSASESRATESIFQGKPSESQQNEKPPNFRFHIPLEGEAIAFRWNTDGIISYFSLLVFYRLMFPLGEGMEKILALLPARLSWHEGFLSDCGRLTWRTRRASGTLDSDAWASLFSLLTPKTWEGTQNTSTILKNHMRLYAFTMENYPIFCSTFSQDKL